MPTMTPWDRVWPAVRHILATAPPGTAPGDLLPTIQSMTGVSVNTCNLNHACRSREGMPPKLFIGSEFSGVQARQEASTCQQVQAPSDEWPKPQRVLATGDWHSPYHDDGAVSVLLNVIDNIRPDVVVLLGDLVDCFTISRFDKAPNRISTLKDEIAVTNDLLDKIHAPKVHYIEGNHEHRLPRFLAQKAPELWGMVSMREMLRIDTRGWEWHDYRADAVRIGKMSFKHDVGRCGKYASFHSLADYGGNICFGHTHQGSVVYQSTVNGAHRVALNTGWLGDVDAVDYRHREMARRDYQHGFGLVSIEPDGTAHARFVPIIEGRCEVDGRLYGGQND